MKAIVFVLLVAVSCFGLLSCNSDSSSTAPLITGIPTDGLLAYYRFDGNCADSSGNAHHGTPYNTTFVTDRFGDSNRAVSFDGSTSSIELGTWFREPYFSFSMWLKSGTTQIIWADIIENYHNSRHDGSATSFNTQNQPDTTNLIDFGVGVFPVPTRDSRVQLSVNVWQHVVFVKDSMMTLIYLNGVRVDTAVNVGPTIYNGNEQLGFARCYYYNARHWNGSLDDARLYRRALTPAEVNALYHEKGWNQ